MKPLIVAHRGYSSVYPENTILSVRKAIELGVDFVEIDVRETKDGKLILMHDEKIDRTTNGKGYVRNLKYSEIKNLDAGKWKGNFKNVKIPTFEEVIMEAKGRVNLMIEIKEASITKVLEIIEKHRVIENIVITSFNLSYLIKTRKKNPAISTALITHTRPQDLSELIRHGIQMVNIEYHHFSEKMLEEFTKRGLLTNIWTVDEEKEMERFISMGVFMITTNYPDRLKKLLQK